MAPCPDCRPEGSAAAGTQEVTCGGVGNHLADSDHDIDCKTPEACQTGLESHFVKKVAS